MKWLYLLLLVSLTITAKAQKEIVFSLADSSKIVTVKTKDFVKLSYNGYMSQPQETEGVVSAINDSSITISPRKKLFSKAKPSQNLMVKDITGFRRYSKFRAPGEVIYGIVSIGITGTITAIISSASVPASLSFLSAAGTQTVTTAMKNIFFSSRIKNHLKNGWQIKLQPSPVGIFKGTT